VLKNFSISHLLGHLNIVCRMEIKFHDRMILVLFGSIQKSKVNNAAMANFTKLFFAALSDVYTSDYLVHNLVVADNRNLKSVENYLRNRIADSLIPLRSKLECFYTQPSELLIVMNRSLPLDCFGATLGRHLS